MLGKFPATHAALLGFILAVSAFITWSAVSASSSLNNLVVIAPVAAVIALLLVVLVVKAIREANASSETSEQSGLWGDLFLLSGFALFCFALTKLGFDVATFLFVWGGIALSGEKSLWKPPLFSALFTIFLVKGFGSLFPYPMLTMVL